MHVLRAEAQPQPRVARRRRCARPRRASARRRRGGRRASAPRVARSARSRSGTIARRRSGEALVAEVGLGRPHAARRCRPRRSRPAPPVGRPRRAAAGSRPRSRSYSPSPKWAKRTWPLAVDEVLRRPVLVALARPGPEVVVERDRIADAEVARPRSRTLPASRSKANSGVCTPTIVRPRRAVGLVPALQVRQRAQAVDARVRPEVDQRRPGRAGRRASAARC